MKSFVISFASHDYDLSIKYSIELLKSCRWALQGLLLLFNASYDFEDFCFERKLVKFWNLPFLIIFLFTCSLVAIYTGLNLLQVKNINFFMRVFYSSNDYWFSYYKSLQKLCEVFDSYFVWFYRKQRPIICCHNCWKLQKR